MRKETLRRESSIDWPDLKLEPSRKKSRRVSKKDDSGVSARTDTRVSEAIGEKEAGPLGFEPRLIDPESIVLPLHQGPRPTHDELALASSKAG